MRAGDEADGEEALYVTDWSPVPGDRYLQAQRAEREYWSEHRPQDLRERAEKRYYAGFFWWEKHRELFHPFGVDDSKAHWFQVPGREMQGRALLDVGCGPAPHSICLVHCAEVHVLDPLLDFYREIQPFGWEHFGSASALGAETLPFEAGRFDFVYSVNALDHARNADAVLHEVARVLRPGGCFLLGCDVRHERGGGPPHPYLWSAEALERRLFQQFEPLSPPRLLDRERRVVSEPERHRSLRWMGKLRVKGP
jgi:SAM-dependent methyltransferase